MLLRYNLEAEGYEVETRRARRRGRHQAEGKQPRSRGARLDAARPVRHRTVPPPARPPGNAAIADHHAHRPRRGEREGARAGHRRRRLHRQAVLGAGAAGPRARAVAPRQSRAGRAGAQHRRHRARPRKEARLPQRPRRRSRADRIPPAGVPDGAARAACSRASNCSTASGAARSISTSVPWMCMSGGCARRSIAARRPTRSARCAAPAMRSTTVSAARAERSARRFRRDLFR